MRFGDKQRKLARLGERDARHVYVAGVTRSGKSEAAIAGTANWAGRRFSGHDIGLVTRSWPQMRGVVVPKLLAWGARNGIRVEQRQYFVEIEDSHGGANRWWYCVAADASQTGERIQGMGFAAVYVDEATRVPDEYLTMCISRTLETPGSKIVATMNPGHPASPFKVDRWDRVERGELRGETYNFGFADNPILDPASVEEMTASFAKGSAFYQRMVLGLWAADEGAVHPHVKYVSGEIGPVSIYEVYLDFAASSVTHALLFAYTSHGIVVVDEWRHDGTTAGAMTSANQARAIYEWATDGRSVSAWGCPVDADGIAGWLHENAAGEVVQVEQDVTWGTEQTNIMLGDEDLAVHRRCKHLCREVAALEWAKHPSEVGVDVPDKRKAGGGHGTDAMRYGAATIRRAAGYRPQKKV